MEKRIAGDPWDRGRLKGEAGGIWCQDRARDKQHHVLLFTLSRCAVIDETY